MKKTKVSSLGSQRGATMVEMSIIFLLLAIFIFGAIDLARYLHMKNVLTTAANISLSRAQKVAGLEIDTKSYNSSSKEYARFVSAYNKAIEEGDVIVKGSFAEEHGSSGFLSELDNYSVKINFDGSDFVTPKSNILILRPGDTSNRHIGNSSSANNYSDLLKSGFGSCDVTKISSTDYDTVLKTCPLVARVSARFHFVTPINWLTDLDVIGEAIGYRELKIKSSVPSVDEGTYKPNDLCSMRPLPSCIPAGQIVDPFCKPAPPTCPPPPPPPPNTDPYSNPGYPYNNVNVPGAGGSLPNAGGGSPGNSGPGGSMPSISATPSYSSNATGSGGYIAD